MVNATPNVPAKISPARPAIKIADPDIIIQNESETPVEVMSDLIFENIGGQELINISRNDLVNGQPVIYSPIKNLSAVSYQYNSNNIVNLSGTSKSYFNNFGITIENKIPDADPENNYYPIYIDENGNLVLELLNVEQNEVVEVQIITEGTSIDDTIYEENNS